MKGKANKIHCVGEDVDERGFGVFPNTIPGFM
jgi:hypothetical protein